ncbi:spinster family MFS transporter [Paraglaciecola hydrolytica]|uniref:MFS transporter n=1 Tax=Paraglaciecola hydrolytica TaxID=1799789 RepID=A0A136A459_9ALTE|nr:MFS transporter [Paraglaciecola hydrolytica]KXI29999.1 MFS transporter [Paraglaciecola hydrolytica]
MEHPRVVEPTTAKTESNAYRNYVLFILTLVYAFNFIDRQIIGILSPFIKADLGLDDAQLGWLKGIYFALLYTVLGIPLAWLADRYNRVNIIGISLTLWSGFTALSGMATNFTQLAIARIGVGIGEAGGSPPSHSIISDLFPKEKRAGALSIYSLGIPFGIMLAFFASAFFLKGGSADWRIVMIAVGLPGVLLAILLKFTVREPVRSGNMQSQAGQAKSWASIKTLLSIKSWWGMCLAISFGSFGNYAVSTWMIDFYVRAHAGLDVTSLLITIGIINGTAYAGGVWLGGVLVDKWGKTNRGAYGLVPGFAMLIGAPAYYISLHVGSLNTSIALLALLLVTSGTYLGPSFALAQTLAPIKVRAMSTALFFFVLNIIALGGGPTFIGVLSQALTDEYGQIQALRLSLSWLAVPYALSILAFFWTARQIPRDWDAAEARNA